MTSPLRILVALAASALPGVVAFSQEDAAEPARPRLVSEFRGVVPGQAATLAVIFDLDEGWHTYWPGQNETGFAPTIAMSLPAGVEGGEPVWPAPHRHESPGGILDYIHEGDEAVILIPISVSDELEAGTVLRFSAEVEWLVCREACIPGSARLSLLVPVLGRDAAAPRSADAARIDSARGRVPGDLRAHAGDLRVRWEGEALVLEASGKVASVSFMPHEKGRAFGPLLRDGTAKGGVLRLTPRPGAAPVRGVVMIEREGEREPVYVSIETRPPAD